MLRIKSCTDCAYEPVCKHKDSYQDEVDILITLQNRFDISNIVAVCKHKPNCSDEEA